MPEPTVLLEEVSPNGNITAVVEQDERVAYFYLWPAKETNLTMRSCWVRNLVSAPHELDVTGMEDGQAPLMPRAYCTQPAGEPPLNRESLRVVWSEEGDAAALSENGELLAVIPSWSGTDGFHGFSRAATGNGPLACELGTPASNVLFERFRKAAEYWASWDDKEFWTKYRDKMLESLEAQLGKHSKYFAIDGGEWPPKALIQFNSQAQTVLVTLGMSLRPQPAVEMHVENPGDCRRIELAVCLPSSSSPEQVHAVAGYLSGQSGFPWNYYTWLGRGHTMPADVFAQLSGNRFPFALLSTDLPDVPRLQLPPFRGDPVSVLWLLPISEHERGIAMEDGSQALLDRFAEAGVMGIASFGRKPVERR